uniref:Carbonic anhydrase 11 n=1 Tax=Pongo abelii TaxID=9601 RepID=A0A8I5UY03_PONAB
PLLPWDLGVQTTAHSAHTSPGIQSLFLTPCLPTPTPPPGPPFWGLVNAAWSLCAVGKRQSPVDVELKRVLYDPFLPPLRLSTGGEKLRGTLYNTGRHVSFLPAPRPVVNVSGGPLLYSHRLSELRLLFGARDGAGSEHQINHQGFSAEVVATDCLPATLRPESPQFLPPHPLSVSPHPLPQNWPPTLSTNPQPDSGPQSWGHALLPFCWGTPCSVLSPGAAHSLQPGTLREFQRRLPRPQWPGHSQPLCQHDAYFLQDLSLELLFPESFGFITYQGSLSTPPCSETVTWILIDRALNITSLQMHSLRLLSQNPPSQIFQSLSGNSRPLQPLAHRALRGNRDPRHPERRCRGPNYRLHGLTSRDTPSPVDPDTVEVLMTFEPDPADLALSSIPGHETFDPRRHRFSEEELKPQPIMKKARKIQVPEEQKDEKYWSRRYKNNEAAKRSRDARRLKENQISVRAAFLEKENALLRQEVVAVRQELSHYRAVLSRYQAQHGAL